HFCKNNLEVVICITGVGTLLSAFSLSSAFAQIKPHFALQAGIGGAFDRELPLGSLVVVRSEMPGDLGVEDGNSIKSVFELGLIQANEPPFVNGRLINPMRDFPFHLPFPSVNSLTVNMASGNEDTIQKRITKFSCDIENMEGASFHYICLKHQVPFLQIRTISNYVEVRD